jgi:diadenosine tetraphosphate (Ap4A) HIT family hydrolase
VTSAWTDPERWRALRDGRACPICTHGRPRDALAEFPTTWVSAGAEAPLPGYACVVSKRHVVEPFELPRAERAAFWEETLAVALALADLFEPVKLNYEIHGNTIPHLHVHLYPRFVDDPYDTGALRPRKASFVRTEEELAALAHALQSRADRLVAERTADRG